MKKGSQKGLPFEGQRVRIFNSGLEVWLYDQSFRYELKASTAFEENADEALFQKAMTKFVKEGKIMAYQLMQDDSLDLSVSVRQPLTKEELATAPWLDPQHGYLRIPSGRLVVESNDSLTIRTSKPTDKGTELKVPAGDYLATLHRIDWDALEADEMDWKGPGEIITLTAGAKAKPVRGQPALLPWEQKTSGKADWKIDNGVYHGAVLFYDAEMAMGIALNQDAIARLGLKDKSIALLSVPELNFECVMVCSKGDDSGMEYFERMEKLHPPAALAGKQWAHCLIGVRPEADSAMCLRRNSKTRPSKKQQNVWLPATMRVVEGQALEKKK